MSGEGKRLGRGLAALLGSEAATEAAPGAAPRDHLLRLAPDALVPNPEQPREVFAASALDDLVASLRAHGVLVPLVARRDDQGGYVLIAGERRWRAAKLAGLADVPVVVRGAPPSPAEQLELALIENLQREDLDPVEAAQGYQRLVQRYGHSQEEVAKRVGKDRATVANALRLLKLPPKGLQALRERRITAGHARALLALEDGARFEAALAIVLAKDLSVRATETLVRTMRAEKPKPKTKGADRVVARLQDQLCRTLGSKVELKPRSDGGGRIVIDWIDGDDLDRLVAVLRGA